MLKVGQESKNRLEKKTALKKMIKRPSIGSKLKFKMLKKPINKNG